MCLSDTNILFLKQEKENALGSGKHQNRNVGCLGFVWVFFPGVFKNIQCLTMSLKISGCL